MNEPEETPWTWSTLPWVTGIAIVAAIAIYFSPTAVHALEYDRMLVGDGQWWRAITGTWVHLDGRDLLWNIAVLLPAGVWAERVMPTRARVVYLFAPTLIGIVLYFFLPGLGRFAGMSGLAAGVVAFLSLAQLRTSAKDRWFWRLILVLLAIKVAAEAIIASRWVTPVPEPTSQAVALIHLAGIAAGAMVLSARRRQRR